MNYYSEPAGYMPIYFTFIHTSSEKEEFEI